MSSRPLFTVFVPTYNRAALLPKALDSVLQQTVSDYEILVVDDGSSDDTRDVIESWSRQTGVPVRYYYQPNGGKHRAHNRAVDLAEGELLMVLDSDDRLLKNCLEIVREAWLGIPHTKRQEFAGVEGLCINSAGELHGTPFPSDRFDSTYLEVVGLYNVKGEKRNALRLDVLKRFRYPDIPAEKHVRPSFIWKRISHHYKMRFINSPLQIVDFSPGGLTATSSMRRLRNVRGLYQYWQDDVMHHQIYLDARRRRKHYSEYVRYALHSGVGLIKQWRDVPDKSVWISSLARALPNYFADLYKMRKYWKG